MLRQQLKLMEALIVKLSNFSMDQSSAAGRSQSADRIAGNITEVLYDPEAHITFDSWCKRHEDLFSVDLAAQDDACAYDYANGNLTILITYAAIVNLRCHHLCSLQSPKDADIRPRFLSKVKQNKSITLHELAAECQTLINLKHGSAMIQNTDTSCSVHTVTAAKLHPVTRHKQASKARSPSSPCRDCGALHFHRDCTLHQHRCHSCSQPNAASRRKFVDVLLNGHAVRLQLDTASDITIISETLAVPGSPTMQQTSQSATGVCGGLIKLMGQLKCCVSFRGTTITAICYFTKSDLNLLGLDWIEQLALADMPLRVVSSRVLIAAVLAGQVKDILPLFAPMFQDGLGRCTYTQVVLDLSPRSQTVFHPKRPAPYTALSLVEARLKRLEEVGVLVPVSYSTWVAPIVVLKKPNGSIRICPDFSTHLNALLTLNCYPQSVPADVFTLPNGGTYFVKLDLADAYLQIKVVPESRELLIINTHRDRPSSIPTNDERNALRHPGHSWVPGRHHHPGRSPVELQDRACAVFERVQEYGFRLRADKCPFFLDSIKYLGFLFGITGRHPDPENIRAIQRMPAPKNVSQRRSFLGLISYYSALLPSLHDLRALLNCLLQKNAPWRWSSDCEKPFAQPKSLLSSDLLLTHYDPTLPITVATDASNHGVSAVISHTFPDGSERAIMHASRTLTPAENYGQIEEEALALVFVIKKFHKLLHGRHFTLLTDHKPLLSIFGSKKDIPVYSASRLQRWTTILLCYDFDILYCRITDFGQADALSRLIYNHQEPEEDTVIAAIAIEDDVRRQLSGAIADPLLRQDITYVQTFWPTSTLSGDLHQFFLRRASLSVVDSCLMLAG
ncbi:hypothetical protein SprV_0502029900 [Sparganum proliferum]